MKIRPDAIDKAATDKVGAAKSQRPDAAGTRGNSAVAKAAAPGQSVHLDEFKSRLDALRAKIAGGDEVDAAKVERISQAVQDGTFRVDSAVVADRMLDDAKALLAKPK
jgi:negative regulator of flagellin synthesis FlgM